MTTERHKSISITFILLRNKSANEIGMIDNDVAPIAPRDMKMVFIEL
ncbi:MAG: hypothetical protein IKX40_08955 [Thermoguttaceae bacterium]|nr:hypothetical protein [Thermoguttaceae bacterium]